ncbi:MAG: electron transport complex subunit RsxC [Clostridia bacterium]
MAAETFKGGIHPPEHKEYTEDLAIEKLPLPKTVVIPLLQHIGAPCEPIVKVKDHVKVGQKIAEMQGFVSAPIHATVSGIVKKISDREISSGNKTLCIEIESDEKDEWIQEPINRSLEDLSPAEIINVMKEAGIVGMGGAGFPTHVKFSLPEDVNVDTIILNGAECEPYLTCDYRLMMEHGEEVVFGLKAMMKAIKINKGIIAIENNKPLAIKTMQEITKDIDEIRVVALETKYPQGGEKQLIDAVLKRQVPSGKLPMHIGVVVNNIHTAYSVGMAVKTGLPLVERVLTISGQGVNDPKNVLVRFGMLYEDILQYCGGLKENTKKVVVSAPMTGFAQYRLDFPIDKRISGVVALTDNEINMTPESICIRCGRCVDVCPINLVPSRLDKLARLKRYEQADEYNIMDCIECSSCAYICPAHRHLLQSIVSGKNAVRAMKDN